MESSASSTLWDLIDKKKWNDALEWCELYPIEATYKNTLGNLPIHMACYQGAPLELIQCVHEANKYGIQTKSRYGKLPVHLAAYNGAPVDVVHFLVEQYEDSVKAASESGSIPLHYACFGKAPLEVIQYLHSLHPYGVLKKDNSGHTPIDDLRKSDRPNSDKDTIESILRMSWQRQCSKKDDELRTCEEHVDRLKVRHEQNIKELTSYHSEEVAKFRDTVTLCGEKDDELRACKEQVNTLKMRHEQQINVVKSNHREEVTLFRDMLASKDEELEKSLKSLNEKDMKILSLEAFANEPRVESQSTNIAKDICDKGNGLCMGSSKMYENEVKVLNMCHDQNLMELYDLLKKKDLLLSISNVCVVVLLSFVILRRLRGERCANKSSDPGSGAEKVSTDSTPIASSAFGGNSSESNKPTTGDLSRVIDNTKSPGISSTNTQCDASAKLNVRKRKSTVPQSSVVSTYTKDMEVETSCELIGSSDQNRCKYKPEKEEKSLAAKVKENREKISILNVDQKQPIVANAILLGSYEEMKMALQQAKISQNNLELENLLCKAKVETCEKELEILKKQHMEHMNEITNSHVLKMEESSKTLKSKELQLTKSWSTILEKNATIASLEASLQQMKIEFRDTMERVKQEQQQSCLMKKMLQAEIDSVNAGPREGRDV